MTRSENPTSGHEVPVRLSEEALRRHSRTLLLNAVGGGGLAGLLSSRVSFSGEGEVLASARLFASRAGLGIVSAPPFDLVVASFESGADSLPPCEPAEPPVILALSGGNGVAIVALCAAAPAPCARCRLASARLAAGGTPTPARASLALVAGAHLASLALAARLPSPIGNAGTSLDFFPIAEPFPRSVALVASAGCPCAGDGSAS